MNKIILIGRLVARPELKETSSKNSYSRFTIAVNRKVKGETDFINCIAWNKQAELITKYFDKGNLIAIDGTLNINKYEDRDGNKRESAEVVIDNFDFVESKKGDNEDVK